MTITAGQVRELRERSGAGIMDCKEALNAEGGDIDAALDYLRKKGVSQAAKKSGRETREGAVAVCVDGDSAALVELACETDFVARTTRFQEVVRDLARAAVAARAKTPDELAGQSVGGVAVSDHIAAAVGELGENLKLTRVAFIHSPGACFASYIHNRYGDDLGRIGVLVALSVANNGDNEGDDNKGDGENGGGVAVSEFARQLAMHVAAANPLAVDADSLDEKLVRHERDIQREIAAAQNKPAEITAKIVEGKMRRFFKENALLEQAWILDGDKSVGDALREVETAAGGGVAVAAFVRFAIGEAGADA